ELTAEDAEGRRGRFTSLPLRTSAFLCGEKQNMPLLQKQNCPSCGQPMDRHPAGRFPHCGTDGRRHVQEERDRETAIEKVVAVISTMLVIGLSLFVGGCTVVEGVLVYAAAGVLVWWWGRRTFGLPSPSDRDD